METPTLTENGAYSLSTTQDPRLNLFFKTTRDLGKFDENVDSLCSPQNDALYNLIDESYNSYPLDTMKILMNWRDCRGGKGDHHGFMVAMSYIHLRDPETFYANIKNIPHFGCYLDLVKLWHLCQPSGKNKIMSHLIEILNDDKDKLDNNETGISLLAKWLPSENSKWDRFRKPRFLEAMCKSLLQKWYVKPDHLKTLRTQYLTPLRNYLNIVETNISHKTYDKIDYEKVPSVAMKKYKDLFVKRDNERFAEYLQKVIKGESKINASQVYPHDLVRYYLDNYKNEDPVIEEQWRVIKEKAKATGAFDDSIVVCDVSASMDGTPMEVAIALGLLGLHNNKVITFSESPELYHIPDGSLHSQVSNIIKTNWGHNTNFEKVADIVLGICCGGSHIKRIFVFSDMQFDSAFSNADATHYDLIKQKFKKANVQFPQIIFWNLRSDTKDFPVECNEQGVTLMSGYSPSLLSAILTGENVTPLSVLMNIINSPRYDVVTLPSSF